MTHISLTVERERTQSEPGIVQLRTAGPGPGPGPPSATRVRHRRRRANLSAVLGHEAIDAAVDEAVRSEAAAEPRHLRVRPWASLPGRATSIWSQRPQSWLPCMLLPRTKSFSRLASGPGHGQTPPMIPDKRCKNSGQIRQPSYRTLIEQSIASAYLRASDFVFAQLGAGKSRSRTYT